MISEDLSAFSGSLPEDTVLRAQENGEYTLCLIDGKLSDERAEREGGVCALVRRGHFLGFASSPGWEREGALRALARARQNSLAGGGGAPLPSQERCECPPPAAPDLTERAEKLAVLQALDEHLARRCPQANSRSLNLVQFSCEKRLLHSCGTNAHTRYERSHISISLTCAARDGDVSVETTLGDSGRFSDVFHDLQASYERLDALYESLLKKRAGVVPRAGSRVCVLAPDPGALLVHEAVGHTVEADLVLGGSVAGRYLGGPIASSLVSVGDFARSMNGAPVPQPLWLDDECSPARDALLIEHGVLKNFMHDRDSAARWGLASTGNARAFTYADTPLIRMRNTAILPGESRLEDLLASVDDGYYLVRSGMGQADVTGEFMMQIIEGYEIKNGRLGAAIRDTVCSGRTFEVMRSVDMVADAVGWDSAGMCGKGQPMPTAAGSPALRCVLSVGG